MNIDERSIVASYAAPTLEETIQRMENAPIAYMEAEIQSIFQSALDQLRRMEEKDYQKLDLVDVLLDLDEDESEEE